MKVREIEEYSFLLVILILLLIANSIFDFTQTLPFNLTVYQPVRTTILTPRIRSGQVDL